MNVAQEQELRVHVFGWDSRLELFEDVEVGEVGLCFVQVVQIMSAPAKGFAFRALKAAGIDAMFLENTFIFGGEIVTHHCDQAHIGEVTRSQGKIGGGTAESVVDSARRRDDIVESDRTN